MKYVPPRNGSQVPVRTVRKANCVPDLVRCVTILELPEDFLIALSRCLVGPHAATSDEGSRTVLLARQWRFLGGSREDGFSANAAGLLIVRLCWCLRK